MSAQQRIRVTRNGAGVRLQWLWWRPSWEGWEVLLGAIALALVIATMTVDQLGAYTYPILLGWLAVIVCWYLWMSSLTVEADSSGVSLRRWFDPGRRRGWRDIEDVTVQKNSYGGRVLPPNWFCCVMVLQGGKVLRIDPGFVGRRRGDAVLVKEHIDQVRGLWDPPQYGPGPGQSREAARPAAPPQEPKRPGW